MQIGIPRETKDGEQRIAVVPDGARMLVAAGHAVVVEAGAGAASGFADDAYRDAGATLADDAAMIWRCPLIVKVKEVQRAEYARLSRGTTIFGFAQLNRDRALLNAVLAAGVRVIGFETVRDAHGALPLLAPMSRIAGRLAPLAGAQALMTNAGGNGTLVTGVDTVPGARVIVVGAGNVGGEAARVAARIGCDVTVFSRGASRLAALAENDERIETVVLAEDRTGLHDAIARADLVICGVLEPGRLSPKLIPRDVVRAMRGGSAIVDVGIDQGGIAETSRMTSLSQPTYVEEGVVHYAVPNMPALVARTASLALAGAALPYVRKLSDVGIAHAVEQDAALAAGVMTWDGAIAHAGLAADAGEQVTAAPWRAGRVERVA
ncbi:MAG TPA: alanine dehydrogenase [Casimicrobiaceae bacterium]|nr:alanine dehydrogenase [Casimicrobiaceae bacterium]